MNGVLDLVKKGRKSCLFFKVDFEKAYDYVRWSFLDYMLSRFGFNDKKDRLDACLCLLW